ncbi:MAG: precorrin-8X methylmutase [Clostridia bacterium]|nr:precorrin-8X methylmutase [Clostridia bacterium]
MIINDPSKIEARSMELIESELAMPIADDIKDIVKRVIHCTADFDYAENLAFSPGAVEKALAALRDGCAIVTDTQMAKAGINKKAAAALGCEVHCYMSDADVAQTALNNGSTRAVASMDKAAALKKPTIFVIGNAPTALLRLRELIDSGKVAPALVIGVPVGFVNILEAKQAIMSADVPYIVAQGRKGGSNVAAAIVNALLYRLTR